MIMTGEYRGYNVTLSNRFGEFTFMCDALPGSFDSMDKIEKALDGYDLKLRKQFSNPLAWFKLYRGEVVQVEVTSLDDQQAWIKRSGKREKVRRSELFEDGDALKALMIYEREQNEMLSAKWVALKRWEPQS